MKNFVKIFLIFSLFSCSFGPKYQREKFSFLDEEKTAESARDMYWWNDVDDEILKSLIEKSLSENLNLKQNKAKIEKYLAQLGIAKNKLFPDVDISASTAKKQVSTQGFYGLNPFTVRNYRQDNITANLDWKLDLFGSVKKQIESANAQLAAETLRLFDAENLTAIAVAREYVSLVTLKKQLEISREQIKNQKRHVDLSSDRFDSGIVDKSEIAQNKILLSNAELQIPDLEFQIEECYARLDILLAKKQGSTKEFLKDKKISIPDFKKISTKTLSGEIIRNNPSILANEHDLIAANARIGAAISEYFPKFSFSANYGFEAINNKNIFSKRAETFSAGPTVSWRILDFYKIDSEIKAAKAETKEYIESYKRSVLETLGQIEIATLKIKKTTKELKINQNKYLLEKENLDLMISQYKSGLDSFINVINAKDSVYKSEIDLLRAKQNQAQSMIDFLDAVY